jgi:AAA domain
MDLWPLKRDFHLMKRLPAKGGLGDGGGDRKVSAPTRPIKAALRFTRLRNIDPYPKKHFLVQSFLGTGEVLCIFAKPGEGKSVLATDLACHVASGRLRGHGAILGAVDTTISVEKRGSVRVACVEKDNDGSDGQQITFDLTGVTLSVDPDTGEETTAATVIPADNAAATGPQSKKLSNQQRIALEALAEVIDDQGTLAPPSAKIPPGTRTVTIDLWKSAALRRGLSHSGKESANRMAFNRAQEALVAFHKVAVWDDRVWQI